MRVLENTTKMFFSIQSKYAQVVPQQQWYAIIKPVYGIYHYTLSLDRDIGVFIIIIIIITVSDYCLINGVRISSQF